jgi:hypothetical protein
VTSLAAHSACYRPASIVAPSSSGPHRAKIDHEAAEVSQSQRRLIAFVLLGLISGATSAIAVLPFAPPDDSRLAALFIAPGLAFGVIVGTALGYGGWLRPLLVPAWAVVALGHFAAALCVTALAWRLSDAFALQEQSAIAIAAALAGALGGGILAGANRLLTQGAGFIAPTIVGAVLGPLVLLHDLGPILGRLVFYGIWQTGYAVALALTLPPPQWKDKSGPR